MTAQPTVPFRNLAEAQEELERRLREWELKVELVDGLAVHFEMRSIYAETSRGSWEELRWGAGSGGSFTVDRSVAEVPRPPGTWGAAVTPLVEQLVEQWRQVRSHEAKILDRAYFCLTTIEHAYGGEPQAVAALSVSRMVLKEVRKLTASSDPRYARKANAHGPPQLSSEDLKFLQMAVPRLILRVAEIEGGLAVKLLSRAELV